ncbi:hypothetical protein B0H63DRAFT_459301 [Podospora didyma]|uniref:Uncharacterized protein n=1 Tax=Podospora didyma TaxID=330526 RepID=A0AAE0P5S0_9PEZI|nr:hypothetical protein B0H63DRAFT_459301 [Podospora didyma]
MANFETLSEGPGPTIEGFTTIASTGHLFWCHIQCKPVVFSQGVPGHLNLSADDGGYHFLPISRSTKSFNAAAVAILVDEREATWNTLVEDIVPSFRPTNKTLLNYTTLTDQHPFTLDRNAPGR